jgi:chemotaxis protein CheX
MGRTLKAAIPSVVTGKNHIIEHFTTYPITAVPFDTDHGGFTVEVCFED